MAQPDQARIVALNAHHFLKNNGHVVISIKATCIDSTAPAEVVYASEVKKMQEEMIKPHEQLTLEPYERDQYVFLIVLVRIATLRVGADQGGVLQRDGRRLVPPPQGLGRQKAQCIGHGLFVFLVRYLVTCSSLCVLLASDCNT